MARGRARCWSIHKSCESPARPLLLTPGQSSCGQNQLHITALWAGAVSWAPRGAASCRFSSLFCVQSDRYSTAR